MRTSHVWLLAAGVALALGCPALAQRQLGDLLDPSTGEIDGQTAVAIYPARFEGLEVKEILGLEGCTLYLKSQSDYSVLARPCGEWFLPPPDRYLYWAEKGWLISPHTRRFIYAGGSFEERGLVGAAPMVVGGRVRLPSGFRPSEHLELRLLHAGPHEVEGLLRSPLSHRVRSDRVREGVLMPKGPTLAAVQDLRRSRLVLLSRPFDTPPRETVRAPLVEPPPDASFLLVQLLRHEFALRTTDDTVQLRIRRGDKELVPAVRIALTGSIYGVWYDLEPGTVELHANGLDSHLAEPIPVDLRAGEISRATGELVARTQGALLDVEIALPPELQEEKHRIEIRKRPDGEVVAQEAIAPGQWQARFEDLPSGVLEVELQTRLGRFAEIVDVAHAQAFVRLEPEVIVLNGQVRRGDEGEEATLHFVTVMGDHLEAPTDADGRYELVSLEWLRSVAVELAGSAAPPWGEFFQPPIRRSQALDLDIPDNRFEVHAVDAGTGRPVSGATVATENHYGRADEARSSMQSAETDDDGIAYLPPLRPGELAFQVHAEGYEPLREKRTLTVAEGDKLRKIRVRLHPVGSRTPLRLLLTDGSPAAGAAITVLQSTEDAEGARVVADSDGRAAVPTGGMERQVIVRHPSAAFAVRTLRANNTDEEPTWRLEPAAPPLSVRVLDSFGEDAAPGARIGLWSGGRFFAGRLLFHASGERPFADSDGYWSIGNLPRGEVALVAWVGPPVTTGAFQPAMATPLEPPWPPLVEIHALGRE